jgi:hypothetical protein
MLIVVKWIPCRGTPTRRKPRTSRAPTSTRYAEARRIGQHADRRDIDDLAALLLDHLRQEAHDEAQRAEVVQLHRPLEIVEAVERVDHAAANRATGVVDEEVADAVLLQHARDQRIARRDVGDVCGIDPRLAPQPVDFGFRFEELLFAASDEITFAPASASF